MSLFRTPILLMLLVAASAGATELAGSEILIPIVGRGPGAYGSEWRTDVVVTHVARRNIEPAATFSLTLSQPGKEELTVTVGLDPTASVTLEDVLLKTFGVADGSGMLRVAPLGAPATVAARARIYNLGSAAGEYGVAVAGIPVSKLERVQLLPALNGGAGCRTNLGIANAGDTDAVVAITLYEESTGEMRGEFTIVVKARSLWRWNDIFGPLELSMRNGGTLRITSSVPVQAFASVVNISGDSDFITGIAVPTSSH